MVCRGKATIAGRGALKVSPISRTLNVAEFEGYLIEPLKFRTAIALVGQILVSRIGNVG